MLVGINIIYSTYASTFVCGGCSWFKDLRINPHYIQVPSIREVATTPHIQGFPAMTRPFMQGLIHPKKRRTDVSLLHGGALLYSRYSCSSDAICRCWVKSVQLLLQIHKTHVPILLSVCVFHSFHIANWRCGVMAALIPTTFRLTSHDPCCALNIYDPVSPGCKLRPSGFNVCKQTAALGDCLSHYMNTQFQFLPPFFLSIFTLPERVSLG